MYSTKEKLHHFRQLVNPSAAEADLRLLKDKAPGNTNLTRYTLAPNKNGEDILFELLDECTHEEIVLNRRNFLMNIAESDNIEGVISDGNDGDRKTIENNEENQNPDDGNDGDLKTIENNEGNQNPDDGNDGDRKTIENNEESNTTASEVVRQSKVSKKKKTENPSGKKKSIPK